MKSIITKAAVAIGIGLITGSAAAYADPAANNTSTQPRQETTTEKIEHGTKTTMHKVSRGTEHMAKATARESKRIAKSTVGESKLIAHSTMRGSERVARTTTKESESIAASTWDGTKKVARTVVHSPVIAYQVMRGERPLFRSENTGQTTRREQMALTGHRMKSSTNANGNTRDTRNMQNKETHTAPPI